ncbi:hypothetical protein Plec18167_002032 [Paecilomyces lecythidis]|uniref:Uncharacterized protein n=1 Tax=Paecilomyces lecythidis TaxID=3004212 RepID=A0ABR3Y8R3_9EURO
MVVLGEALEATEPMVGDTDMEGLCIVAMAMENLGVDGRIRCTKAIRELVPPELDANDGIEVPAIPQNIEANPNMDLVVNTGIVDGDTVITGAAEVTATTIAIRDIGIQITHSPIQGTTIGTFSTLDPSIHPDA